MSSLRAVIRISMVVLLIVISLFPTSMMQAYHFFRALAFRLGLISKEKSGVSRKVMSAQVMMVHVFSKLFCRALCVKVRVYRYHAGDMPDQGGRWGAKGGINSEASVNPGLCFEPTPKVMRTLREIYPGPEPRKILYMANHISFADVGVIGSTLRTSFLAKQDVLSWPLIGWMTEWAGILFVHRESVLGRLRAMRTMKLRLRDTSVCVFPEGTTTSNELPDYSSWHSGNVWCVMKSGESHAFSDPAQLHEPTPIVCLSLCYHDTADNAWVGDLSFVSLLARIARRRTTLVYLIWSPLSVSSDEIRDMRRVSLRAFCRITTQSLLARGFFFGGNDLNDLNKT